MRMRFIQDTPILSDEQDGLGFGRFVDLVHNSILQTDTPFVYGILGDWGAGKTSAMQVLKRRLEQGLAQKTSFNVPIWLNVWKYENEANMIYPILYCIKKDFEVRLKSEAATASCLSALVKVVGGSALALTDLGFRVITKTFAGEALSIKDVADHVKAIEDEADAVEKALSKWADEVSSLGDMYAELITRYSKALAEDRGIPDDQIRFVFLIDDLDRCLPEVAVSVLEKIKNFLCVSQCVYVLGLNPIIIYQGIRSKYPNMEIDGREYIEKILNYSYFVPEANIEAVSQFTSSCFKTLLLDTDDMKSHHDRFELFGKTLSSSNFTNPRKIKRLLNRYLAFLPRQAPGSRLSYRDVNIIRLMIIAEYYPDVFRLFVINADGAKSDLIGVSEKKLSVEEVEKRYGLALRSSRDRIVELRQLFELESAAAPGERTLQDHVDVVRQLSRTG